jgi:hypothetical protein
VGQRIGGGGFVRKIGYHQHLLGAQCRSGVEQRRNIQAGATYSHHFDLGKVDAFAVEEAAEVGHLGTGQGMLTREAQPHTVKPGGPRCSDQSCGINVEGASSSEMQWPNRHCEEDTKS